MGVEVLAAGQCLPGQAPLEFEVSQAVLGDQALLQPAQFIGLEAFGEADGVVDVEGHIAVEHQFAVVADEFAHFGDTAFVLVEAPGPVGGAVLAGELEGFKT